MSEAPNPRVKVGGNNPPSNAQLLREKYKPLFNHASAWLVRAKKADLAPKTKEDCAKLEALFAEARDLANDADGVRSSEKEPFLQAGREVDELFNGEIRDKLGTDTKKPGLARQILQAAADRRLAITRAEQRDAAEAAERVRKEADRLEEQRKAQEDRGQVKQADVTAAKVEAVDRKADTFEAQAAAPVAEASRDRVAGRSVSVDAVLTCAGVVRKDLDLEELRPYFKQEHLVEAVNAALKMKAFSELKGAAIVEKAVGRVR